MKKLIFLFLISLFSTNIYSQNNFKVIVEGLKVGDSATIILQKGAENLLKKYAKKIDDSSVELNFNIGNGKWALKVDAAGYTFPSSKLITVPDETSAKVTFTKMLEENYKYTWNDDESSSGHATQTYVGEPTTIVVKDKTVKVPSDYSSVKLRKEFGIVLSDDIEPWSMEDSYRLYSTMLMLPYNPDYNVNFETGDGIRGIFYLTNDEQYKDLTISSDNGLKNATISQPAFTYASPLVVTVDGIKGKFYSKRLYHVLVNYLTEFGSDEGSVDHIAMESFGFKFMKSNDDTQELMGENKSNFQEFFAEEKVEILAMFEELPEGFHKQEELKYMVRRINGQSNPQYPEAPAIAWVGMETIEWMEKSFKGTDLGYVHRLILHEKAHFLWEYSFNQTTKDDWAEIGGWYQDPTAGSGWSTTNTTEFVSAYAHAKNPNEDMAESIAAYVTNPDILLSRSVKKYEFIRDRIMHGTRYVAQIREDLTFTVYNLYPDYTYPGKIIGVEVEVVGAPEEDKTVKMKLKLEVDDIELQGATKAQLRFVSNVGTYRDMWLEAQNGDIDSILVGETFFSKHDKNGYWVLGGNIDVRDKVGNSRYENHSTIGLKLFINSPLEDFISPLWDDKISVSVVEDFFNSKVGGDKPVSSDSENAKLMKAIKADFSFYDDSPMQRAIISYTTSNISDPNAEVYGRSVQDNPIESTNGYKNIKDFSNYLLIHDYFPSGYYSTTNIYTEDIARNTATVYLMENPDSFNENVEKGLFSHQRDSIYIETKYPDYLKPEIDVNNIIITAEPVNPTNPDGETNVNISYVYRDLSEHEGHESGVKEISFVLRDPLGKDHSFRSQNNSASTVNRDWLDIWYDMTPDNTNEWRTETFTVRLPKGSAPGKWGLLSTNVQDKANNIKKYSFVEYVRFDVIESDVVLTNPLEVEIVEKAVNASNVDNITAKMSCSPCKDLNYVYTIYSRMGGGGAVVRGEGVFESDTIVVNNIKTSGVLDGLLNLTVQVTDSTDALVATKTAEYLKDVVYPKSYYSRSNIQDQGWSNIDNIVIDIEVESQDVNGTYNVNVSNNDNNKSGIPQGSNSSLSSFDFNGDISESKFNFNASDISNLTDGYLKFTTTITDQVGNVGDPVVSYYLKNGSRIQYVGNQIDPSSDEDQDGIPFSEDNSPTFWNPGQEDVDNDGIGDWSDNTTIMVSISDRFKSDTVKIKKYVQNSINKIYSKERLISEINATQVSDPNNHLLYDKDNFTIYASNEVKLDYLSKYLYDYKLGVTHSSLNNSETVTDSLDIRIYLDFNKPNSEVTVINTKLSHGLEYELKNPYLKYENNDWFENHREGPSYWREPDFESNAYFVDVNNDGLTDMIIGDQNADIYGQFFNINHIVEPVYLINKGDFNFEARYNAEHQNIINKTFIHSPNITIWEDINDDNKKELLNFGEDYHVAYPPHHRHYNYIKEWLNSKGLKFGVDYNDYAKKLRYYTVNANSELEDQVSKIDISLTSSDEFVNKWGDKNINYLKSMYASTTGDIDNDGDLDLITSGQNNMMGYSFDILKNDGSGNFTLTEQLFTEKFNTSEGHMLIVDLDQDGNNDLLFGGQEEGFQQEYSIFAFLKGDGSSLDTQNLIILEKLNPSLGLRNIYYEDINGDDIKELIAYFTVGFGCNGCGLKDEDIPNIIKIYELVDPSEGYIKDISESFFNDEENYMDFYSQNSYVNYFDLDGDGFKDIVPKFHIEDPKYGYDYPGNAFRGYWNDSDSFQFFKYNRNSEKYDLIEIAQFNDKHHSNYFDFFDLNNDGSLDWLTRNTNSGTGEEGIYIYEFFFKPRTQNIKSSVDEDNVLDVTLEGSDVQGDDLTYSIVDEPTNGTTSIDGDKVTYTPNENYNGEDTFTYKVNDGTDDSNTSTVTITVNPVNDAPTVADVSLSTKLNTDGSTEFDGSDIDEDTLIYVVATEPENGSVSIENDTFIYSPDNNYVGQDTFTYKANDGSVDSNEATVTVDIEDVDTDNDSVSDRFDICPDTPEGTTVDVNGCEVFDLPLENNKVWVTSASCIGNTDGSIGLSIEDDSYNYTVTVTGQDDPISLGAETKTASVTGLGTGAYTVCFKVDGQDAYEQCFEVNIGEPKALSAFIDVDNDNRTTSIQLSGSSSYNIEVNGQRFDVKGDRFTTNLPTGLSIIKISTDLDCQGIIEREIFISEDIHYYPNPTQTDVNVHVSGEDTMVQVSVFSEKGDLIYTREQQIQDFSRKTNIDLSRQITGTYIVVMDGPTVRKTFKIVKR